MADPLLSSLCRICNTNPIRYRCPRCGQQTCSMACSKRHKSWTGCSGLRDPTVYRTRQELLTPAGIDHDYNFISAIERGVERSERLIVEERGLVARDELHPSPQRGRQGRGGRGPKRGETALASAQRRAGVIINWAPKGMKRSLDNNTYWNRNLKCINWRVEWILEDGSRCLSHAYGNKPIEDAYALQQEEERRKRLTTLERKQVKAQTRKRQAKKARLNASQEEPPPSPPPQMPNHDHKHENGDNTKEAPPIKSTTTGNSSPTTTSSPAQHFYLHKPHTPSSGPRVLIHLQPTIPFDQHLQNRMLIEFPTIYMLPYAPDALPFPFALDTQVHNAIVDEVEAREETDDVTLEEGEVLDSVAS